MRQLMRRQQAFETTTETEAFGVSIYFAAARHFGHAESENASCSESPESPFILDIGGEGRHPEAWNLNPRTHRSLAPHRGEPIPRLIRGRGESIPLPERSVDLVIVERTPLRPATLHEIQRVAKPGSFVVLRHAALPWFDPHRIALRMLRGAVRRSTLQISGHTLRETAIHLKLPAAERESEGEFFKVAGSRSVRDRGQLAAIDLPPADFGPQTSRP